MSLEILLIDTEHNRTESLARLLEEHGHNVIATLPNAEKLTHYVHELKPDMVIVDMDSPDRDTLENISVMSTHTPRPIVFFANTEQSSDTIGAAINAGVSAYICDGVQPESVKPIIDTAVAQFNAFSQLRQQRDEAVNKLEERTTVDKAKVLLMKHQGWDENMAHKTLRKLAMDRGEKLIDIAQHIIDTLSDRSSGRRK